MDIPKLHDWPTTQAEAIELQRRLAGKVIVDVPLPSCERIAGADISYNKYSNTVYAGVVVLNAADLSVVERKGVVAESPFPYVPGLLSFREAPVVLQAFRLLATRPDAVMCDGQGLAHQRRFGLACHLGLWLDLPCFGCAKSRLVGSFTPPGEEAGATSPLTYRGEVVGAVVRTKRRTNPVFVSPGHKIDLASAVRWTLATCKGYRIPEPTRQAHLFVNELRRGEADADAGGPASA
jgi:deoxyribonuclease V